MWECGVSSSYFVGKFGLNFIKSEEANLEKENDAKRDIVGNHFDWGMELYKGVARGKGGNPPPETEKIVVEKWCYFRKLYF